MPKLIHHSFKVEYPFLSQRLITRSEVICTSAFDRKSIEVNALWDTGAMISAITPIVAQQLNLVSVDRIKVNGVNNVSWADLVKISVKLPNLISVNDIFVAVCNLVKDVDLLIGMDIIVAGDLCISNGEGKTLFSFAMPPFTDKTDLYEKH
jgi:hypothetical protein